LVEEALGLSVPVTVLARADEVIECGNGCVLHRSECLLLTDAVEKARGVLLTRNNRIIGVDFLNRIFALWMLV
jgi:hypothetical protein